MIAASSIREVLRKQESVGSCCKRFLRATVITTTFVDRKELNILVSSIQLGSVEKSPAYFSDMMIN